MDMKLQQAWIAVHVGHFDEYVIKSLAQIWIIIWLQ